MLLLAATRDFINWRGGGSKHVSHDYSRSTVCVVSGLVRGKEKKTINIIIEM